MKKTFATLGMVIGILVLVMGLLFMFDVFGGYADYINPPVYYDFGYASFGADFYTYVNNNAAEAATGSRMAANYIVDLMHLVKNAAGIFLMAMGLICFCYFGCVRADAVKIEATIDDAVAETPVDILASVQEAQDICEAEVENE